MTDVSALSDEAVAEELSKLSDWSRQADTIAREFELPRFPDAIAFVVRVGFLAEEADHHPDIDIRYRTVRISLTTHSAGGLTEKDFALATSIDDAAP